MPAVGHGCDAPAEAEVPAFPVVDEDEFPAVAPVEGEVEPGAVWAVLLLPATPVVPVEPDVLLPVVPAIVPQLPFCGEVELLGFIVEGCVVVPGVGVFGLVDPGTGWVVALPGGVAVLPWGVAVLPCGVAVVPEGDAV